MSSPDREPPLGPRSSRTLRKPLLLSIASVALGIGVGLATPEPTSLTFLAVGQGDCAVFRHAGATILIDAGPVTPTPDGRPGFDAGERVVVPRLRAMGVRSVDLILLTHPDADHVGGTKAVLGEYPNARLAASAAFRTHAGFLADLAEWGVKPERVLWLPPSARLRVGDFRLLAMCPSLPPGAPDNAGSVFLRLQGQGASATLTGDAPAEVEARMAPLADWSAQILKAGHHGSRTATGEDWLREVRPQTVVVSCGRDNRYDHPHRSVLQAIEKHGARAMRTDREGDITFVIERGRFIRAW